MALETAFELLGQRATDLQTALDELDVFIADKPEHGGDVIVVNRLTDALDDLRGWLEQVRQAVATDQPAATQPLGLEQARRSLMAGQEHFNHMLERATQTGLMSFDSLGALADLADRRGGEWAEWVTIIRQSIEHSRHAMYRLNDALFIGWRELTEQRSGRHLVSVQTTNIGQQVAIHEPVEATPTAAT